FFKYLWLAHNYRSPYMELTEREREGAAMDDADLTENDVNHPVARAVVEKYQALLNTRLLKLFNTGSKTVDKIREYLDDIDLMEVDSNGDLVHDVGKVMKQVSDLGKVSSGLEDLEYQVKKQMESKRG